MQLKNSRIREKHLKLVKKPIFSENGVKLGEGYVEEYVTINTETFAQR